MRSSRFVWVGIVVVSLWAATVFAQPHHGLEGMAGGRMLGDGPGMMLPMVLRGLDLTDQQQQQVHDIMKGHRATFRSLFRELRATHRDMTDKLLTPGEVSTADLAPQIQRAAQLREQLMQEGLKVAFEVRAILTPEQMSKAAALKDRMRALHAEMRELFADKH